MNGRVQNARVHFTVFDVETNQDWVRLEYPDAGLLDQQTGYHRGDVWTNWVTAPTDGSLQVYLATNVGNCNPNGCGFGSWNYRGASMREYRGLSMEGILAFRRGEQRLRT